MRFHGSLKLLWVPCLPKGHIWCFRGYHLPSKNVTGATQWFCKTNGSLATGQDRVLFFKKIFLRNHHSIKSPQSYIFSFPLTGYSRTNLRIKIFSKSSKKLKHFDLNSEVLGLCSLPMAH